MDSEPVPSPPIIPLVSPTSLYRLATLMARRYGWTGVEAEDCAAEIVHHLWQHREDFPTDGEASLWAWLWHCAENCAKNYARSHRHQDREQRFCEKKAGEQEATCPQPTPEDVLCHHDFLRCLHEALASLPPHLRTPWEQHYLEEVPVTQLASMNGQKVTTLYKQLERSCEKIGKALLELGMDAETAFSCIANKSSTPPRYALPRRNRPSRLSMDEE